MAPLIDMMKRQQVSSWKSFTSKNSGGFNKLVLIIDFD